MSCVASKSNFFLICYWFYVEVVSSVPVYIPSAGSSESCCRRKAFFCRGFADNKCEGLKNVESGFLLLKKKRKKEIQTHLDIWGLTQNPLQSMQSFPNISEGFGSEWHLLFILGYAAWILIAGAVYTGYKSCCSHRDCHSPAAHSAEAVLEIHRMFCDGILLSTNLLKWGYVNTASNIVVR